MISCTSAPYEPGLPLGFLPAMVGAADEPRETLGLALGGALGLALGGALGGTLGGELGETLGFRLIRRWETGGSPEFVAATDGSDFFALRFFGLGFLE